MAWLDWNNPALAGCSVAFLAPWAAVREKHEQHLFLE